MDTIRALHECEEWAAAEEAEAAAGSKLVRSPSVSGGMARAIRASFDVLLHLGEEHGPRPSAAPRAPGRPSSPQTSAVRAQQRLPAAAEHAEPGSASGRHSGPQTRPRGGAS